MWIAREKMKGNLSAEDTGCENKGGHTGDQGFPAHKKASTLNVMALRVDAIFYGKREDLYPVEPLNQEAPFSTFSTQPHLELQDPRDALSPCKKPFMKIQALYCLKLL